MPTKAQEFRNEQARNAHPPKAKKPKRPRKSPLVDTSLPGVSATDRSKLRGRTRRSHAEARGGSVTEEPMIGGKPSRKSTRKSTGRIKLATNLQRQAVRETQSPSATATRAAATKPVRGRGASASTGAAAAKAGKGKARGMGANNRGAGPR